MHPVGVSADTATELVQLQEVNLALLIDDNPDGDLVITLLLILHADGDIGQGFDGGQHGVICGLALLEAHIPDGGRVLVDIVRHSLIGLGGLLKPAILDGIIVGLDLLLNGFPQRCQFGGAFFSCHFKTLLLCEI